MTIYQGGFSINDIPDAGYISGVTTSANPSPDRRYPIPAFFGRNAWINSRFTEWQGDADASQANPATLAWTADRMRLYYANAGTLPTTLTHSKGEYDRGYKLTTTGAGSGFGVSDYYFVQQKMVHGARDMCDQRYVTVAFDAFSDITDKKVGVGFVQNYGTGGSPSSEETINGSHVTLTSTRTRYGVTIQTNTLTAKTFGTANDDALIIEFFYMWGELRRPEVGDTVDEDFGGSGSVTIDNVDVYVNSSDGAIRPFRDRPPGMETTLCLPYLEVWRPISSYRNIATGFATSATNSYAAIDFHSKRAQPTITSTDPIDYWESGSTQKTVTARSFSHIGLDACLCGLTMTGGTADKPGLILMGSGSDITIRAEI